MTEALKISISIEGIPLIDRILGTAAAAAKDLRPAFNEITKDFERQMREVFDSSGAIAGYQQWTPLNRAYAAKKQADGYGTKILVRTGQLKTSLTGGGFVGGGVGVVRKISKRAMTIGTKVPYAKYHQRGTRKMPKRDFVRVSNFARARWMKMIQAHLIRTGQFSRVNL